MDASTQDQISSSQASKTVAPVDSDSFVDTVLGVAQARADEAVRLAARQKELAPAQPVVGNEVTIDLTESAQADAGSDTKTDRRQRRHDRRQARSSQSRAGHDRRRSDRRDVRSTEPRVQVVSFEPLPGQVPTPRQRRSMWRRLRRRWREWRIQRAPRHRHTLAQRLQYRWWRRQDRRQRQRALGAVASTSAVPRLLVGLVAVSIAAIVLYLVVVG